ncbi:hypothetical protein [Lapillicoccus sp.]|uniref:hypothetical protein n=1 Tax=Lapillicoccus sp. TaxID=1909287 RepID=UPI003263373D
MPPPACFSGPWAAVGCSVRDAVPFLAGSATSGSTMRLLHDIVPTDGFVLGRATLNFVLGRATLNLAVGVMQVAGYGLGGMLLVWFSPSALFLIASAAAALTVVIIRFGICERPGNQSTDNLVRRTHTVNRTLLGSPVTRPLYLAIWVPNGLIVGCEALFVPFGGQTSSGLLFAAAAAGMLLGDVLMGRVVPPEHRDRLIEPLRLLLAVPYLAFLFSPGFPLPWRSPSLRPWGTRPRCPCRSVSSAAPTRRCGGRCSASTRQD